jgi:hypothetical protein
VNIAATYIGVTEMGGDNKGEIVEKFQKAVDGKAQGEPWCVAFCCFCLNQVQEMYGVKHNLILSEHSITMWNLNPCQRWNEPMVGDIAIWKKRGTQSGHAGIVSAVSKDQPATFETIEGNTSPSIGIERNGDGVYRKKRSVMTSGDFVLMGFLRPF